MTAEDFDRDVENVGRLPGKSGVQGSTGLLLATISLTGKCRESNIFMQASSQYQYNDTTLLVRYLESCKSHLSCCLPAIYPTT
jgi:hypothetical protein